ncbi:hypothetical protein VTL71DRAFT_11765 [Oculimacula yallundae]|uniref:Mtf2-like C-terminal domain-containing protein n=1 Tax=Oculimacula yallundae TaxID=86028 RepID=A0ABR4CS69_9HELO
MLGSRAAAEAGPTAISSLSTSMPFLYQTKTISNWSLTGATLMHRPRYCNAILRRHYSEFRISRVRAGSPQYPRTRSTNILGHEAPAAKGWYPNAQKTSGAGSEGTRAVEGSQTQGKPPPTASRANSQAFPTSWSLEPGEWGIEPDQTSLTMESNESKLDDGMDFVDELGIDDEPSMIVAQPAEAPPEEIQDLTRKHGARDSTITDTERTAFQKIFSDIFNRSNRSSVSLNDNSELDNDPFEMDTEPRDLQKAKDNLGNILSSAMQRQPTSRKAMEEALEKYPEPLRAAAATAMGYIEDEMEFERTLPKQSAMVGMKELEALRAPERLRVEGLMNAARSDFELLEVMEKEVFSLIPKLGLSDGSEQDAKPWPILPGTNKKKKGWKKAERAQKSAKKLAAEPQTEPLIEQEIPDVTIGATSEPPNDGISPLALYGPLYPSYLLLGLRLFDRSFAKPSPLSLSLLPKIKSLGYISRILGGSTQFYNELLRIYRYRHDNFRGMVELLEEMEYAAVEFDEETFKIVGDLRDLQLAIHRGEKGKTLKALWSMPDFVPNGFSRWRDKIYNSIVAREDKARDHLQFPGQNRPRIL